MCVMNISLTWANFALITGVCLVGYYLVIGLAYYRKDLLRLLSSKREQATSFVYNQPSVETGVDSFQYSSLPDTSISDNEEPGEDKPQHVAPTIEDFMDEIYACTQACGKD